MASVFRGPVQVAPFERWVSALGIQQTIFFRAEHLPNYELSWIDLRNLALINRASKTLVDAVTAITWPVLRVSVPGHAMGLLPHFAVVGHELGHAIQDQIKLDFQTHQQSIADAVKRIQTRLQADGLPFTPEDSLGVVEILGSWVNELKADAVGHYIAGPAFFFALCGFLELSGHGYGIGRSHPPSDLRRKLLFERLTTGQTSFASEFLSKAGLQLTEELTSPSIAKCLPPDDMYKVLKPHLGPAAAATCVELLPVVTSMANDVFDAAKKELASLSPDLLYTPEQFTADIERHLEPLCHLIPPIEYTENGATKACSLSTVLNVGWSALLTRVDQFPPSKTMAGHDQAARMETLHDLLLKAVELAEARRLWEEQG